MATIQWEASYADALGKAKREGRLVLLDFFAPG